MSKQYQIPITMEGYILLSSDFSKVCAEVKPL